MVNWRERGYVPDSDDDEEESQGLQPWPNDGAKQAVDEGQTSHFQTSQQAPAEPEVDATPNPPVSSIVLGTAPSPLTGKIDYHHDSDGLSLPKSTPLDDESTHDVATQLEQEISKGLDVCRDILRSSQKSVSQKSNKSESPLSSVPSSPVRSPASVLTAPSVVQQVPPQPPPPSYRPTQPWMDQPIRSLRQRAPLQLHPYSLEAAKYQRDWQQRGLRPIRITSGADAPRPGTSDRVDGGSEDDTFPSSQAEPNSVPVPGRPRSTSEEESQSPVRYQRPANLADMDNAEIYDFNIDDEIPNLEDIFNLHDARSTAGKPRTEAKPLHRKARKSYDIPPLPDHLTGRDATTERSGSLFDLPPSPPRSRGDSPSAILTAGKSPAVVKPLLTPGRSSELRPSKRHIVLSSSSEDEAGTPSADEESAEEAPAFVQMRRKIKGVLPASWIKLDALHQAPPTHRQVAVHSPEKHTAKGVARHVSPSSSTPTVRPTQQFEYSSESEDSEEVVKNVVAQQEKRRAVRALFDADEDTIMDDAFEEDTIDRMAPPDPRRISTKPRKKRQQRLSDTWDMQKSGISRTGDLARRSSQSKLRQASHTRRKRQKRARPAQLSILDAPGLVSQTGQHQPRYLRVAARSAYQKRIPRPQNPQTKFFELGNAEDNADITSGLSDWRDGNMISRAQPRAAKGARSHLSCGTLPVDRRQQRSAYGQSTSRDKLPSDRRANVLRLLRTTTESTLSRIQNDAVTATSSARSNELGVTSTAQNQLNAGFISWHGNRAGRGEFWNSGSRSRPTQLETLVGRPRSRNLESDHVSANNHRAVSGDALETSADVRNVLTKLPTRLKKQPHPRKHEQPAEFSTARITLTDAAVSNGRPEGAIDDPNTVQTQTQTMLIAQLVSSPDIGPMFPSDGTQLVLSAYVSGGHIARALNPEADADAQCVSGRAFLLKAPNGGKQLYATGLTDDVNAIVEEILEQVIDMAITSSPATIVRSAIIHVEEVADYLKTRLNNIPPGSLNFITKLCQTLEGCFTYISSQYRSDWSRSIIVSNLRLSRLFLGLAIACFRTLSRASMPAASPATNLIKQGVRAIVRLLTGIQSVVAVQHFTQIYDLVLDDDQLVVPETWIFLFAMSSSAPLTSIALGLNDIIAEQASFHAQQPLTALLQSLNLIPGLQMLSRIDSRGVFHDCPIHRIDAWPMLTGIRGFLDHSIGPRITANACVTGISTLRLCLWLSEKCGWIIPDALLQLLFRQYGKYDMLELFVQPSVSDAMQRVNSTRIRQAEVNKMTDFQIFLRLVSLALEQRAASIRDGSNVSSRRGKLTGLVFSLIPNNSRATNEDEAVANATYLTMANTYALYTTLYAVGVPDCRPRLSQVENLVTFATSHAQIRDLTIAAWADMSHVAVHKGANMGDHEALGQQGRAMWKHLVEKATAAIRSEVNTMDSTFHHEVVVNNCKPVLAQLTTIIKQWTALVSSCASTHDIEPYFEPSQMADVVQVLQFLGEYLTNLSKRSLRAHQALLNVWRSEEIDIAVLELLRSIYFRKMPELQALAIKSARDVVSNILSSTEEDTDHRLQKVVDVWFSFAKLDSNGDFSRLIHYLQPPSSYSFRMLADTRASQQCAVLFLSKIIAEMPVYFELDPEALYQAWIVAILQADDDLRFEHVLTEQVLLSSTTSLGLGSLAEFINIELDAVERHLSLATLKHLRPEVLKHVVRAIWNLQFTGPDDSQDLIEELVDVASGRRLLHVITDTIRRIWTNLSSDQPQKQDDYKRLVRAVVDEMEIYTLPDFELDSWFADPQKSNLSVNKDRFRQLFKVSPTSESRVLDEAFIVAFRQENQRTANTPGQSQWVLDMVSALSCNDIFHDIKEDGTFVMDGALQVSFMQNVLSVYIEESFSKGSQQAVWAVPVLHILLEVLRKLHLRQDLETGIEAVGHLCLQLLHSTGLAISIIGQRQMPRQRHILMFAVKLFEIATCCIERLRQFRRLRPEVDSLHDMLEPVSQIAGAIFTCISDPTFVTASDNAPEAVLDRLGARTLLGAEASSATMPTFGRLADVRQKTAKDLDAAAATRGHQPAGLASSMSAWYEDGQVRSWLGWEDALSKTEGIGALARAVTEFGAVAAEGAEIDVDDEWRMWDNLARYGSRVRPFEVIPDVDEDDSVADYWED